jgi:hypothetical protein
MKPECGSAAAFLLLTLSPLMACAQPPARQLLGVEPERCSQNELRVQGSNQQSEIILYAQSSRDYIRVADATLKWSCGQSRESTRCPDRTTHVSILRSIGPNFQVYCWRSDR